MNRDGTDEQPVARHGLESGGGRYAPDGRSLVLTSLRNGQYEIHQMDVRSRSTKLLHSSSSPMTGPCFHRMGHGWALVR